jgi:putative flippase GtrA
VAGELRGWHPDPFNTHERRYFSMDGQPTRLVCDDGRTSHDPPRPTPLGASIGTTGSKQPTPDQGQTSTSGPQSGANALVAPGSIAFPPLVATQEWEHDRPAIGQICQSVGGDERRTELTSTAPAIVAPEEGSVNARKPEILDLLFPHASRARRAALQRLSRYGLVSLISMTVGLAILGVLIGACGYPAIWANVIATAVPAIPSFEVNRRWVWGQHGERSVLRQAVPYFLLCFAGLVVSSFAVHIASDATSHSSRLVHTSAAELANVAAYGSLWLVQFLLCDRILFRSPDKDEGLSPATVTPTALGPGAHREGEFRGPTLNP